ncbi:MAG: hypothetical protein FWC32_09985 [Firmicutes bacterium]|nr:hypothetical protein [Bacillota bacterium]
MKKIFFAILFFVVAGMALSGCESDVNQSYESYTAADYIAPTIPAGQENQSNNGPVNYWQGMRLYVEKGSVTPTGLRLTMINDSDSEMGHGTPYSIQQYVNGEWQQVPFTVNEVIWIMPLFIIGPGYSTEENINWEHMHGQLPPGRYRVVRNFMRQIGQQSTPGKYMYAIFTIEEDWADRHTAWQAQQDCLTAAAFARFQGLDLNITQHSPRGLSFTVTNNNPYYSYIINGIFMGWEDNFPGGGSAGALEYFIFSPFSTCFTSPSWPYGNHVLLQPGDYLSLDVDWYYKIGYLTPREAFCEFSASPYPHVFELVMDILLDVDEEYIYTHFRHSVPGLPGMGHRIKASFEI